MLPAFIEVLKHEDPAGLFVLATSPDEGHQFRRLFLSPSAFRESPPECMRIVACDALSFFRGSRFGKDTSNMAERSNARILSDRDLPVLDMLLAIWQREMDPRPEKYEAAAAIASLKPLIPYAQQWLSNHEDYAQRNTVEMQSIAADIDQVDRILISLFFGTWNVDIDRLDLSIAGIQSSFNTQKCQFSQTRNNHRINNS
ncbi:hypothetical protein FPQ18DRAFT_309244 [Pyronema domesticum]|nr:hypothetical protein FPQ18DRAFT_309244 [Pyronema domesticum]